MVRTAIVVWRIAMARQNDLRLKVQGSGMSRVKIIHFKPQQHTVTVRQYRITDAAVMMPGLPTV